MDNGFLFRCSTTAVLLLGGFLASTARAQVSREPTVIEGAVGRIRAIAISSDGKVLATAGYDVPGDDSGRRAIRLWSMETKKQVRMIAAECDTINAIALSPDGTRAAIGDRDGTVACWNTQTGQLLFQTSGTDAETEGVLFSADGKRIVSGSDKYYSFDSHTGRKIGEAKTHDGWAVNGMAMSRDGKLIVSACGSDAVVSNAANMSTLHVLSGHERSVDAIAISTDKKRIATGCYDGTITLWDTASGKELTSVKAHSADGVISLAFFDDDRRFASGGEDGKLRIWDVATGKAEQTIDATSLAVDAIAVSPDGKTLVTTDNTRLQFRTLTDDRAPTKSPMTDSNQAANVIDLSNLELWEVVRGDWMQKDAVIIGSGNSRINTKQNFPNEFSFRCKLKVNGPTNPRIRFGSFHFGYEGDDKQFFLHGPKASGERFSFEFSRVYQIEVTLKNDQAVLRIDGKVVATSNPKQLDERMFSLEAGGVRSNGSAEFSEMTLTFE